jgi:endonuclease/exonuclease/phosphatase family metal-dependent hydrolase
VKRSVGVAPIVVAALVLTGAALWLQSSAQAGRQGVTRVMTYNVEWFSEDADAGRVANLRAVLAETAPDVVGLQEIQSRKALAQIFPSGEWQIGIADDPNEAQELAIAVRKPHVLVGTELLFRAPALDPAFPNGRDVLRAVVQTPEGAQLVVYVVHMKSRSGGRSATDWQRETAAGLLASYIAGRRDEPNAIVVGDFNDAPDDRSVNILETGDLLAAAGPAKPRLLHNLTEGLADRDFVTYGVNDLYEEGKTLKAVAKGAQQENARLRGKDYRYPDDVRVKQTFMDQLLATPALAKSWTGRVVVYSGAAAVRGEGGRTQVANGVPDYSKKGTLASDHLPVYADLRVLSQ